MHQIFRKLGVQCPSHNSCKVCKENSKLFTFAGSITIAFFHRQSRPTQCRATPLLLNGFKIKSGKAMPAVDAETRATHSSICFREKFSAGLLNHGKSTPNLVFKNASSNVGISGLNNLFLFCSKYSGSFLR